MMNRRASKGLRDLTHFGSSIIIKSVALPALTLSLIAVNAVGAPRPPPGTSPYRLSRIDITQLTQTVCATESSSRNNVITAWKTSRGNSDSAHAFVECSAHRTYTEFEAYHAAHCERTEQWRCGRGETRIHNPQVARRIDIGLGGYNPDIAYQLVNKIAAYRTKKGDAVIDTEDVRCDLAKGPSKELIEVTCKDRVVRISYWCPQSTCPRIFSVNGYFVPADAGGL